MSRRTVTMLVTFVLFTVIMTGVGWVAKRVVPPFIDWAGGMIGLEWVAVIMAMLVAGAGIYAYRAEMASRRSERSF